VPDDKKPPFQTQAPDATPAPPELPPEDEWDAAGGEPEKASEAAAPSPAATVAQTVEQADKERDDDEGDEEEQPGEGDKFRPEAIAARIDAIGDETDLERVAREEEKKLIDRKRKDKKKKGKGGLESAASKRLAKIGEGTVRRPSAAADALSPEGDSLLESAARAQKWIGKHRELFGGLVAVGLLGTGGFFGWAYWQDKRNEDASAVLAQAFSDEHGRISEKADDEDDDDARSKLLYPTFKSAAERRDAALAKYRAVESKFAGSGAAILARLGEAALLLDAGDAKGALAAYEQVRRSALAAADPEVRGRAIEGRGFANELLAQSDPAAEDKYRDEALSAYKELQGVDMAGMKELGMYHEARVLQAKGDRAKAVDLLKEVHKLVTEPTGEGNRFSYLEFVVEDRLRDLDPTALPPKAPKRAPGAGPGGNGDSDNAQMQQLMHQMTEQARQKGGAPR
jgi:hypothetical protein